MERSNGMVDMHAFTNIQAQLLLSLWNVVVVAHIYPPVTRQRQMITYWMVRTLVITMTTL